MAKKCCVCDKKLGLFDAEFEIIPEIDNYVLCLDCNTQRIHLRTADTKTYPQIRSLFQSLTDHPSTPLKIKEYFFSLDTTLSERSKATAVKQAEEARIKHNQENMLLTTGSNFEGYRIVKYLEVLCEEVVFKNSFMNRLSASFEDFGNSLTLNETEMSGSSELIARARAYVMEKFRASAAKLGANAVLGVDFESSIGSEIVRVAVFGTAVVIEPAADYTLGQSTVSPAATAPEALK